MKKLLTVLVALGLLLAIAYFCVYKNHAPAIEKDLSTRVIEGLNKQGLTRVDVDVSGRDIVLTGLVGSLQQKQLAEELAKVDGYNYINNSISVSGESFALPLSRNTFAKEESIRNKNLLVTTVVSSGQATLNGVVTQQSHTYLINLAHKTFGKENVIDNYVVAESDNINAVRLMGLALEGMDQVSQANVHASVGSLNIRVASPLKEVLEDLELTIQRRLPEGTILNFSQEQLALDSIATGDEIVRCQKQFTQFSKQQIVFASASANLQKSSYSLLDKISKVSRACTGMMIEIHGHTDSQGRNAVNKALSKQRALAVKRYLVKTGVARYFVKVVGHGEEKPISTNKTAKGRARNRRIEFNVKQVAK